MRARFSSSAAALVRRFRAQRPLRAGSLLITLFGDAIAPRGGAVTLGGLISLAAPFGLPERLVRTSVARLAREGWLQARRAGRRSEYRLTPLGARRFAAATRRIYAEMPGAWDEHWTLLVLPASGRDRQRIRDELRWLGFGQLAPGFLAHASCTVAQARAWLSGFPLASEALIFRSRSEGLELDRRIVTLGWDLADLEQRYLRFIRDFEPALRAVAEPSAASGAAAFVVRSLLIHQYRKVHLRDPLLPEALLPVNWLGARAYELCRGLYSEVFAAAEQFVSTTAATLTGAMPEAEPGVYARFGGLAERPGSRAAAPLTAEPDSGRLRLRVSR